MEVIRLTGKVDGVDVIFNKQEDGLWKVTIPQDLDGMYVVELTGETETGDFIYYAKVLLIINAETLRIKIVNDDFTIDQISNEDTFSAMEEHDLIEVLEDYIVIEIKDDLYVEVLSPGRYKDA